MKYYLYILQAEVKESYYTGVSDDPDRRHFFHNNDGKGYTRRPRPWNLIYTKAFNTKEEAPSAERVVKNGRVKN